MPSLHDSLTYHPVALSFGTSGLRGLAADMTDLECYINTTGFLHYLKQEETLAAGATLYLAGDLRESTPRILRAVQQAITDNGFVTVYCGRIPTPALAYYAGLNHAPCIMVTGSHIPADRNGIKFYKSDGEVLKQDEAGIEACVARVRQSLYQQEASKSPFTAQGLLRHSPELAHEDIAAATTYVQRYTTVFAADTLVGASLLFYQHSSVGRDVLPELLRALGATVTTVGRSDVFIPIDSENVTADDRAYFRRLIADYPGTFAILSTDGDSDRPFLIDETGTFHPGDVLGAVVAAWLKADFAAYPASTNDSVDTTLDAQHVEWKRTKIGSPYVISAMQSALVSGKQRVVGWEVNGGFLTGSDFSLHNNILAALPTRDAIFPLLCALSDVLERRQKVSQRFAALPQRFTQAGLIDGFPVEASQTILQRYAHDTPANRNALERYFSPEKGFGAITHIDVLDGIRLNFDNGDVAHIRPSSNAPQLRLYSVADTSARADEIVQLAVAGPNSIFRTIEKELTA